MNHHRTYRPERDGMGGAQMWWVVVGLVLHQKNGEVFHMLEKHTLNINITKLIDGLIG